jgi:hypothetical protein
MHLGLDFRILENLVRGRLVAHFPMKDVVALFLAVLAQDGRGWIERLVGID